MARLFGTLKALTRGRVATMDGKGKSTGNGTARRIGEDQIEAEVSAGRRTTASILLFADGSGLFTLTRDGVTICERWNDDTAPLHSADVTKIAASLTIPAEVLDARD